MNIPSCEQHEALALANILCICLILSACPSRPSNRSLALDHALTLNINALMFLVAYEACSEYVLVGEPLIHYAST